MCVAVTKSPIPLKAAIDDHELPIKQIIYGRNLASSTEVYLERHCATINMNPTNYQ